jgi:RecA-family ATPase
MNIYDDDFMSTPNIGQPLVELLAMTIEPKPQLHKWLPAGLSLLAGKAKAGKSTVAEQIASEVSKDHKVCYLALEYNVRTAQARFNNFENLDNVHTVIEGQVAKFGKGAEEGLKDMVSKYEPALIVIDVLAKLKRPNMGNYDQEYEAMSELKELVDQFDIDCLAIHHTRKAPSGGLNTADDPFDTIMGSTALQGAVDNTLLLSRTEGLTKLSMKGRLIDEAEILLSYKDGKYLERTDAGAAFEASAPLKAEIVNLLAEQSLGVTAIADRLDRHKGQISEACKKMHEDGVLNRNENKTYYLTSSERAV